MVNRFFIHFLLVILILLPTAAYSVGNQPIIFSSFSADEGLSNPSIRSVTQDAHGFLWIGTDDGLNRFDGHNFNIFRPDPYSPTSISSSIIHHVVSDSNGNWSSPSISFSVAPPLWQTIWLQILLVVIILLLVYILIKVRIKTIAAQTKRLEGMVEERTAQLTEALDRERQGQEEIHRQNEELRKHREMLESLVMERTQQLQIAKENAEESDRIKTSFLANMSHEIRTPMNAIMGFISLLKSTDYSLEEKDDFINSIEESSHALLRIINDILDISLLESGGLKVIEKPTNVSQTLCELEQYFQVLSTKKVKVSFQNSQQEDELWLRVDALRFKQIFNNIIDNAVKYTEAGEVTFGYELNPDFIQFFVADTGPGIPSEHHEVIFERFHKLDIPMARMYPGTGIGLTICRSLVEMLGGSIQVDSEVGRGTTIIVKIPIDRLLDVPKEYKPLRRLDEKQIDLSGTDILIAEDEPANFHYIRLMLKPTRADVYYVEDGQAAVDFVSNHNGVNRLVILMDIRMPKMNGAEAAKLIKEKYPDVVILAQTAQTQQALTQNIDISVFDDYLVKPIHSTALYRAIVRCV